MEESDETRAKTFGSQPTENADGLMKIAVASGKGGTGKTTAPTNLAWVAAQSGLNVAYLDCDVEEPNGHLFLKPATTVADCGAKKGGARMTTGNILSVRGLEVKRSNRRVGHNLSFDVDAGDRLAIISPGNSGRRSSDAATARPSFQ